MSTLWVVSICCTLVSFLPSLDWSPRSRFSVATLYRKCRRLSRTCQRGPWLLTPETDECSARTSEKIPQFEVGATPTGFTQATFGDLTQGRGACSRRSSESRKSQLVNSYLDLGPSLIEYRATCKTASSWWVIFDPGPVTQSGDLFAHIREVLQHLCYGPECPNVNSKTNLCAVGRGKRAHDPIMLPLLTDQRLKIIT